jgi:site-specific DNA recombinase
MPGIPAAVYFRMSDDRQENSIDRQKSQVLPFAEKRGYEIVQEYADHGIPGDEIAKRRGFQRMLRDAQAGQFQAIICDDKDRFGRFDAIDLGEVVAPLRRKGVWVETVAQGRIDWNTFAGRITDAILQEAKSMESEAISRRVLSAQLLKAQKGITTGGRATYGYRWEESDTPRLVSDGRKAEVVRLIFRLYDLGHTLMTIGDELYKRGVPSPRGGSHWTRTVIARVLTNRRYVGDWTWGVHPQGKRHRFGEKGMGATIRGERHKRQNPAEAWVVIPDTHEALVDRDQFERVQARLLQNRTLTTPHKQGGAFVFNRLLVCSHCGSFMSGITVRKRRNYICRGYLAHGATYCNRNPVAEAPLLTVLMRKLKEAFLDATNLAKLREEIAALEAEERSDENIARLRKVAADLAAKIDQGNERLVILPPDRVPGVVVQLRKWEQDQKAVLAELGRLEKESPVKDLEQSIEDAEAILWKLQEALTEDDRPLLRQLFRDMISRVELCWNHEKASGKTWCRLKGGTIWMRSSEASSNMFPSGGR